MKCSTARQWISDYVDGELGLEREKTLRDHLDACAECRGLVRDFQKISREARDLPSLEPSPSAWSKIAAGLRESKREAPASREKRPGRIPWLWPSPALRYALASLLALAVLGGIIIGLKPWRGLVQPGEKSFEYTLAKLKEAQRYYEKAIAALEEAVEAQENGLNPRLAEVFKRNLEAMDQTIQACRQMVRRDPDNLTVRTYLLTAYREKVSFLEDYMGLKKASARETAGTTI